MDASRTEAAFQAATDAQDELNVALNLFDDLMPYVAPAGKDVLDEVMKQLAEVAKAIGKTIEAI
jgi:hypothetical protein